MSEHKNTLRLVVEGDTVRMGGEGSPRDIINMGVQTLHTLARALANEANTYTDKGDLENGLCGNITGITVWEETCRSLREEIAKDLTPGKAAVAQVLGQRFAGAMIVSSIDLLQSEEA